MSLHERHTRIQFPTASLDGRTEFRLVGSQTATRQGLRRTTKDYEREVLTKETLIEVATTRLAFRRVAQRQIVPSRLDESVSLVLYSGSTLTLDAANFRNSQ